MVEPFIRNKLNKTFVDLALLQDDRACEFARVDRFQKLNGFEQALLVHVLVQHGGKETELAKSIVESLEATQKSIKKNFEEFKHNFDTIINAKESEEKEGKKKGKKEREQMLFAMKRERGTEINMMQMEESSAPISRARRSRGIDSMEMRKEAKEKNKPFTPIESTKEYAERTYYNVKDYEK